MIHKETLVFQLEELRNEFADALDDLTQEQLTATPHPALNPIGWIACHCMHNWDFFIHQCQTNTSLLTRDGVFGQLAEYGRDPSSALNPPPDLSSLPKVVHKIMTRCIDLIKAVDEQALSEAGPFWHHRQPESTSGNCVRIINHTNAHLRQIWMVRGYLGDETHWPVQTLAKRQDEEGYFYVQDRESILSKRINLDSDSSHPFWGEQVWDGNISASHALKVLGKIPPFPW